MMIRLSRCSRSVVGAGRTFAVCAGLLILSGLESLSAEWIERKNVGAFEIRSEFSLQGEGALLKEMASLGDEISELLGIEIQGKPTEILLFNSRRSYQEYLSHRVPEGVNRSALFVKIEDVSRVYAYRCPELATNLRHESTHALLHSSLAIMPLWLDEGLAEYFEVPAGERTGGNPHLHSLRRWNSRLIWKPDLNSLAAKQEMSEMSPRDYRDAFGVVHFLLHGPPEARETFRRYLAEIQEGRAPDPLERQLSGTFRSPSIAVVEHIRNWE